MHLASLIDHRLSENSLASHAILRELAFAGNNTTPRLPLTSLIMRQTSLVMHLIVAVDIPSLWSIRVTKFFHIILIKQMFALIVRKVDIAYIGAS